MSKSKLVPFLSSVVLLLIPSIANAEVQENDSSGYVIDGPPAAGQKTDATIPHTYVPYFGQSIEQPKHILNLYPDPGVGYDTPGFQDEKWDFTTTEEMMAFLNELDHKSDLMQMEIAGYSQEGREIPLLLFTTSDSEESEDFNSKPTVWLEAQVHGSEAGAGEAALVTAQQLATGQLGEDILKEINVIIVPRVNPDGSHYYQFGSARGLWINRDHMKVDLPETKVMNQALQRFQPEVFLTSHEYGHRNWDAFADLGEEGGAPYHDFLLAKGYNLNIPASIREMADDLFIPNAFEYLEEMGYSTDTYVSFPEDYNKETGQITVTEGNASPRFEKEIAGLLPSFTFLLEGRGDRFGREGFERRVHSQVVAIESFLRTTVENKEDVKAIVAQEREELVRKGESTDDKDTIVITNTLKELEKSLEVLDIATGEVVEVPTTYLSATHAEPTLERIRPKAYLLPPAYHHVVEKLEIHGVEVKTLNEPQELTVESYTVTDQQIGDKVEEGHIINKVETEIKEETRFFPEGSYVFEMNQTSANIIALALEPESEDSYVTYNIIPVNVGDEVPVYRYMNNETLDGESVKEENEGGKLPDTSTDYLQNTLWGMFLIIVSSTLLLILKTRKKEQKE
ncbi:M14 family zinc carboxypeptidase [Shouchella patagoniensis]|uniref:M14 family zinc carboxypeptidase n=1 Tax=Shouchella patagoniensis TaxID=228576 RepID=UPI0009952E31|nr:M14 family zinc carboxypeptidase [Shouchella patagoniensis]